ncbi:MAG: hypothetical protein AVDCRST_MAG06-3168 [uncultured Nocardioides sp.]|uniref:Uncharacterized protein n=1 Tax=uncultured Nocardioides sp. TaxID=198441 RepID=A0A6J4PP24_9ACTN|nr:MAG: hypothetical protein AVDCRST_MAG06-3168 [uncultured Nocardioides sp.]
MLSRPPSTSAESTTDETGAPTNVSGSSSDLERSGTDSQHTEDPAVATDRSHLDEAIGASLAWYDDIHAMHGIRTVVRDGLWRSTGPALPWHSIAKTLHPDLRDDAVASAVADRTDCSVADTYGTLDLSPYGFTLLFEAQWLRHPGGPSTRGPHLPEQWSVIDSADRLATWSAIHDYAGVLTEEALSHPRLTVLARYQGMDMLAGAVLNDAGPTVGLSNLWSLDGHSSDVDGALAAAHTMYPGHPVTAYAQGDELARLTQLGFVPLGPHRVWLRSGSTP